MKSRLLSILFLPAFIVLTSFSAPIDKATDYLGIPGPVKFDGSDHMLAWSSHPSAAYYKHEYVQKDDNVEHFKSMIMIDAIIVDVDVKDAVNAQINVIEKRKKSDAVARYELIENPDKNEYILDFIMSESQGDKINIVEWNAYRYSRFQDASGHKGIMLFAISKRGYGEDVTGFLSALKTAKTKWVNEIAAYKLPVINITK